MNNHKFESAYIDESGDDGAKGSKYFVISLWCTSERKEISKIVRSTKQRLLAKNKTARWLNKKGGEIKYSGFPDKILLRHTLSRLAKLDSRLYYVAFKKNKSSITKSARNMILAELLGHIAKFGNKLVKIIADTNYFHDKKIAYFSVKELNPKSEEEGFSTLTLEEFNKIPRGNYLFNIKIEHHNSKTFEELQALDLLSGAIFTNYEYGMSEYLDILNKGSIEIKEKVIEK